jgi:L-iditol 2-dehydrogenase
VPAEGEVLVTVKSAGICRTDVYVADGSLIVREPLVIGHEAAGVVMRADAGFDVGERVAINPALSCLVCATCASHGERPCADPVMLGVDRDGAFAEVVSVPARALVRVPNGVRWEVAAMAEPVAAALGVLRAPIDRRGRGAVYGSGRIADLLVRVLEAGGFAPIAWSEAHGDLDWVVEARAIDGGLDEALRALRPGGTLVLKSRPANGAKLDVALAVRKEITIVARSYGPFDDAVAWLASGRLRVDDLVGEVFPLERHEAAFAAARAGERHKVFFTLEA